MLLPVYLLNPSGLNRLYLKDGQTTESIEETVQEMDYSFKHDNITSHEIRDILDIQIPVQTTEQIQLFDVPVDPFDIPDLPE